MGARSSSSSWIPHDTSISRLAVVLLAVLLVVWPVVAKASQQPMAAGRETFFFVFKTSTNQGVIDQVKEEVMRRGGTIESSFRFVEGFSATLNTANALTLQDLTNQFPQIEYIEKDSEVTIMGTNGASH